MPAVAVIRLVYKHFSSSLPFSLIRLVSLLTIYNTMYGLPIESNWIIYASESNEYVESTFGTAWHHHYHHTVHQTTPEDYQIRPQPNQIRLLICSCLCGFWLITLQSYLVTTKTKTKTKTKNKNKNKNKNYDDDDYYRQTDYRKLPSHSPWRRIRQGQKVWRNWIPLHLTSANSVWHV